MAAREHWVSAQPKTMKRLDLYLWAVFGSVGALTFLAITPLMIWRPGDKPDWPALAFVGLFGCTFVPALCFGFLAWRAIVTLRKEPGQQK